MNKASRVVIGSLIVALLALTLVTTAATAWTPPRPPVPPPQTVVYNLYATDGWVTLADGTQMYIYGYIGGRASENLTYLDSAGVLQITGAPTPTPVGGPIQPAEAALAGNAQLPAPCIYARVGDVVQINFKNLGTTNPTAPNDPHTIHLHGLDVDAANDGVPETSVAAVPANSGDPGAGNVIVYMFSPKNPGTYMYHCHQEADIHVQMGMYGALVVYNKTDAAAMNGGPGKGLGGELFGWKYDKDVILLLTEVDLRQHVSEETSGVFNPVDYQPRYWLMNGLSFPNTIHAGAPVVGGNFADWLAAHPNYDPLITGSASAGTKVLVRLVNLGFETQPIHWHGFHAKVIGSDQRAWYWGNAPWGSGLEKNTVTIGSGETYELLFNLGQQKATSTYPAGTQTRYDPITGLLYANTQTAYPGIPADPTNTYLTGPTVTGAIGVPAQGQFFPMHNHDDYKATNDGVYPGGQFTMIEMLP